MAEEKKTGALAMWASGAGVPAQREEIAKALLASANAGSTGSAGDDVEFLTFSGQGKNFGGWKIGRDKVSPDPEAIYVIDPLSAVEGWTCWKNGGVAEKHEWSVFERATKQIPRAQLQDHDTDEASGDGWQFMMGIAMFDVDAPGKMIKFTTTSKSGRNVLSDLTREIATRLITGEPHVPVVLLGSETFQAQGKTNGKPKLVTEGWVTTEEVGVFLSMGDDGDVETLLNGGYAPKSLPSEEPEPPPAAAGGKRRLPRRSAA